MNARTQRNPQKSRHLKQGASASLDPLDDDWYYTLKLARLANALSLATHGIGAIAAGQVLNPEEYESLQHLAAQVSSHAWANHRRFGNREEVASTNGRA